eukprot:1881496-Pyramimonas_sp.AAC.1
MFTPEKSRHGRSEGIVHVEGTPRVQLEIGNEKDEQTKSLWNYASAQEDNDAMLARCNAIFHASEEVRWLMYRVSLGTGVLPPLRTTRGTRERFFIASLLRGQRARLR